MNDIMKRKTMFMDLWEEECGVSIIFNDGFISQPGFSEWDVSGFL